MLTFALTVAGALLGVALAAALWRLLQGPDLVDRLAALDALYANSIGWLLLTGIGCGSRDAIDAVLLMALLGVVGTVAFARFLLRGDIAG